MNCPEIRISERWRTGGGRMSPGWEGVPGAARSTGWGTVRESESKQKIEVMLHILNHNVLIY